MEADVMHGETPTLGMNLLIKPRLKPPSPWHLSVSLQDDLVASHQHC